jgi:hypothetical protein
MINLIQEHIPQLGVVIFNSIGLGVIIEAHNLTNQVEENERANVFSNFILSRMFYKPHKTPEDIDGLPVNALIAVIDVAVEKLQMHDYFTQTPSNLPVRERFFKAFLKHEQEIFENLRAVVKQSIVKLAQPVMAMQETHARQVQEVARQLRECTRCISVDPAAAIAISFRQVALLAAGAMQRFQTHQGAVEAFKKAGWPIPPSMPFELIEHIVTVHKAGKTGCISRIIIGYYQRNDHQHLIETVKSWKSHPLFAPRMHILQDALQAHCQKLYTLSVPTLIPQIEGVLADCVFGNKLDAKLGKIRQVYEAAIGNVDDIDDKYDLSSLSKWVIATTILDQQNKIYGFTDFKSELEKPINRRRVTRHTVLHGVGLKYDRPIHSLRVFLLLDALSSVVPQNGTVC